MDTQNQELEQMRQQMALLKDKLDQQVIVNDRLIQESMRGKMSWLNRSYWLGAIILPIIILALALETHITQASWGPVITFIIMSAIGLVIDWKMMIVKESELMSENLLSTAERLQKISKLQPVVETVSTILALFWAVWFLWELFSDNHMPNLTAKLIAVGISILFVAAVSIPIIIYIYKKVNSKRNELLRQIQELRNADGMVS